jgi:ATP-dependent DNA ligase
MERVIVARTSTLPKRLQPMLATLTDGPFDDNVWIFEDKYDGFRMAVTIEGGEVTLYTRNGKIISHNSSMRPTVTASKRAEEVLRERETGRR